jgi:hypothetical protein
MFQIIYAYFSFCKTLFPFKTHRYFCFFFFISLWILSLHCYYLLHHGNECVSSYEPWAIMLHDKNRNVCVTKVTGYELDCRSSIWLFSVASRQATGPTQPPLKWLNLTTHRHLVPGLRMRENLPQFSCTSWLNTWCKVTTFLFFLSYMMIFKIVRD